MSTSLAERKSALPTQRMNVWQELLAEEAARPVSLRAPFFLAVLTLFFGLGGFVLWASQTQLSQAAFASGRVIVESKTKTVSHLEGGTLQELLVGEGEHVKQGQVLALLDSTRSKAEFRRLGEQLYSTRVRQARLTAERDGATTFSAPSTGEYTVSTEFLNSVMANERRYMVERLKLLNDQLAVDSSLLEQAVKQQDMLSARLLSLKEQFVIVDADYQTIKGLADKKLATRQQLSTAKYNVNDVQSQILQTESQIAEAKERQNQIELNKISRKSDWLRQVAEDLQNAELEVAKLSQDIVTAQDVVAKSVVRAPQDGTVANIQLLTPGSALNPGAPLLDVVPTDQPFLIEGRARASDIETLGVGRKAEIRLSAFSAAEARPLIGEIIYLAPDSKVDERTGETTYALKARISDEELRKQPNVFLHPGMTADIYVVGGSRTALDYLLLPIEQSFDRAFREK